MRDIFIRLKDATISVLTGGVKTSLELFTVMVPIIIVVKVLKELNIISHLAWPLKPLMGLVGLPAEMGLVWATAILNNIYSGMIVFLSLVGDHPLTTAQVTVLGVLLLVAHGLPVELSIARKSGPRLLFQGLSRMVCALILGMILHHAYGGLDVLQGPATVLLPPPEGADPTLWQWALGELKNLASIFVLITGLLALMKILNAVGVIALLNRLLRPVLRLVGIGPKASTITVVGLGLGISYGGGLIIHEARHGGLDRRDVFYSLTLMGVCHSVVEDTLLMIMLGGHLSGLLWARLGFALIFVAVLVRLARLLSPAFCDKHLWGPPGGQGVQT